jgi:hypothetical protein
MIAFTGNLRNTAPEINTVPVEGRHMEIISIYVYCVAIPLS